jgi:pilus assembly protein CpaB
MRKWRAIITIVLAIMVAATTGMFTHKWLQKQVTAKEVVQVESEAVPVAIAAADLTWGTKLKPEMVEAVHYLKESLPPGHFSNPESLIGRVLIVPVKKSEPILESRLAPTSVTTGGVSAIVKPGKRALAVKGDKVIGISGFIRPSDRVDVLVTITNPRTKREMTKTVLEGVLVLATGTEIQENPEGGKPHSVDVYTLEVTPEEGEKLALAATQGKLQFALRNVADIETVLTRGATISSTLASFRPKERVKSGKRWVTPKTLVVEVIKGDKVTKMKFKHARRDTSHVNRKKAS